MRPTRIFETVLYAEDLAAAERFYRHTIGLEVIGRGDLAVVFRCGGGVLLIFDPRKSGAPGRDVPSHGTSGAGHIAFGARCNLALHPLDQLLTRKLPGRADRVPLALDRYGH